MLVLVFSFTVSNKYLFNNNLDFIIIIVFADLSYFKTKSDSDTALDTTFIEFECLTQICRL